MFNLRVLYKVLLHHIVRAAARSTPRYIVQHCRLVELPEDLGELIITHELENLDVCTRIAIHEAHKTFQTDEHTLLSCIMCTIQYKAKGTPNVSSSFSSFSLCKHLSGTFQTFFFLSIMYGVLTYNKYTYPTT